MILILLVFAGIVRPTKADTADVWDTVTCTSNNKNEYLRGFVHAMYAANDKAACRKQLDGATYYYIPFTTLLPPDGMRSSRDDGNGCMFELSQFSSFNSAGHGILTSLNPTQDFIGGCKEGFKQFLDQMDKEIADKGVKLLIGVNDPDSRKHWTGNEAELDREKASPTKVLERIFRIYDSSCNSKMNFLLLGSSENHLTDRDRTIKKTLIGYKNVSVDEMQEVIQRMGICHLNLAAKNSVDDTIKHISKTSVLFVSVSFIILMVISLAWLVFYYVQRFRYAHAKDRLAVAHMDDSGNAAGYGDAHLSADGQSSDGQGSSSSVGGSYAAYPFPGNATDSDIHDPFFPSPAPSPTMVQQVLHPNNAPGFSIIPVTVHSTTIRRPASSNPALVSVTSVGAAVSGRGGLRNSFNGVIARGSDSSSEPNESTGGGPLDVPCLKQMNHSAEVHQPPPTNPKHNHDQSSFGGTTDDSHGCSASCESSSSSSSGTILKPRGTTCQVCGSCVRPKAGLESVIRLKLFNCLVWAGRRDSAPSPNRHEHVVFVSVLKIFQIVSRNLRMTPQTLTAATLGRLGLVMPHYSAALQNRSCFGPGHAQRRQQRIQQH